MTFGIINQLIGTVKQFNETIQKQMEMIQKQGEMIQNQSKIINSYEERFGKLEGKLSQHGRNVQTSMKQWCSPPQTWDQGWIQESPYRGGSLEEGGH